MRIVAKQASDDGKTTLYTMETDDKRLRVLTTYVDRPEKHIICFTTTAGCQVGCDFCYAGDKVLPVSAGELYQQVYLVHQDQGLHTLTTGRDAPDKPVLISAMGEGEPLASRANYDAVIPALKTMGTVFARARLALSTTAIQPSLIRTLATEQFPVDFKLQISLISPRDDVRRGLMRLPGPPLVDIRGAVGYYEQVSRREVEWNLVLMEGINDSPNDAFLTARLLGPGTRVKLNGFNKVPDRGYAASPRALAFYGELTKWGLKVEMYQTDGWDVGAACGQFRAVIQTAK